MRNEYYLHKEPNTGAEPLSATAEHRDVGFKNAVSVTSHRVNDSAKK